MVRDPTGGGADTRQTFVCPICDTRYLENLNHCPDDGAELVALQSTHPRDLVGETIADRYEVIEHIAIGGMGVVYKARQKMVGRNVAIKILPRELAHDTDTERCFFNEARAISQLRHPNIVTLFDFGRTEARDLFIVMEYVKGDPLSAHLERGPMPLESVVQIAEQICSALEEAHRVGIIHRDVKPDNVMLEVRAGRLHVRLLDFGIAKSDIDTARQTRTGVVFGTPEYISPEQVLGRVVDARADLYGVGLILYEMLSGARPFEGSGSAIAYKHAHDPVPVVAERHPDLGIPAQLSELVRALMSKDPLERPSTASGVRRRLQQATMLPIYEPEQSTRPMPLHPDSSVPPRVRTASTPPRARPSVPHAVVHAHIGGRDSSGPLSRPWEESDPRGRTYDPAVHASVSHSTRNRSTVDRRGSSPHPRRTLLLALLLVCVIVLALVYVVEETTYRGQRRGVLQPTPTQVMDVVPAKPAPITQRAYDGVYGDLLLPPTPRSAITGQLHDVLPPPTTLDSASVIALPETPEALRTAVAATRSAKIPKTPAQRVGVFARRAALEWATANAQHTQDLARYEAAATVFLGSDQEHPPPRPVPVYGNAVAALQWLVAHEPAIPALDAARYYLGRGLASVGRADAAAAQFRAVVARHPQSPFAQRARWPLALAALERRDWARAQRHLRSVLDAGPGPHRAARFGLAHVHYAQGRYEACLDHLHQVVESLTDAEGRAVFWDPAMEAITLVYARLEGGRRQARSYFRGLGGMGLVIRQGRLLGFALGAQGRGLDAIAVYGWLRAEAPGEGMGWFADAMQAQNQVDLGDYAAAEALFTRSRQCGESLPPSAMGPCLYALGLVHAAAGHGADARAAWGRLEKVPVTRGDVEALHWQAAGRYAQAESLGAGALPKGGAPLAPEAFHAQVEAYTRVTALGLPRWSVPAQDRIAQLHAHRGATATSPALATRSSRLAEAAREVADRLASTTGLARRWRAGDAQLPTAPR